MRQFERVGNGEYPLLITTQINSHHRLEIRQSSCVFKPALRRRKYKKLPARLYTWVVGVSIPPRAVHLQTSLIASYTKYLDAVHNLIYPPIQVLRLGRSYFSGQAHISNGKSFAFVHEHSGDNILTYHQRARSIRK